MAANGAYGEEGGPVGQEKINTDIVTLSRFLTEEQTKHKEATGDFTFVAVQSPMWFQANFPQTIVPCPPVRLQDHKLLHPKSFPYKRTKPKPMLFATLTPRNSSLV